MNKIKFILVMSAFITSFSFTANCTTTRSDRVSGMTLANLKGTQASIITLNAEYIMDVGDKQITGKSEKSATLILFSTGDMQGLREIPSMILSKTKIKKYSFEAKIAAARAMESVGADGILITSVSQKVSGFWPFSYKKTVTVTGKPLFIKGIESKKISSGNEDRSNNIKSNIRILNDEIAILRKAVNQRAVSTCCKP